MSKIIACITTRDGNPNFAVYRRLQEAAAYAADRGIEVSIVISADNYGVAICRNRAVASFLGATDGSHLFFLDNDVHIQRDALVALLSLDAPIAAGCYPSFKSPTNNKHMHKPYITVKKNNRWLLRWFDGPLEVDGAGTGCMLIRRDVLETVGYPWFVWREWLDDNFEIQRKSDDIDFCDRARELGFVIVAHGNVRCGHIKECDAASFIHEDRDLDVSWMGPIPIDMQEAWPEYGSHVPALQTVIDAFAPSRIVEYGCGRFSTPAILSHSGVLSLISYESNIAWLQDTQRRNRDDRLTMNLCPIWEMPKHVHHDADVVLVDCDVMREEGGAHDYSVRTDLIRAYQDTDAIVIVHDYNFADIKPAVDASTYTFRSVYTPPAGPQTAVLSNKYDVAHLRWVENKRKSIDIGLYADAGG